MIFSLRIISICACVLLAPCQQWLIASEPPDPWSDLRPIHAVRCLGELRAPLDAQPDDQRLLGLAISAYVVLCFNAHPEIDGAFGPWLDHAHVLVARRRVARAQAATPTLEAAAPELWVRLIDGDAAGVIAELDRFPVDAASPHGLALRALATCDWRPLAKTRVRHALVDYARMVLFHRTSASQVGIDTDDLELIDPYVVYRSSWIHHFDERDAAVLPGEAVAAVGWLLQSRQLDDATAIAEAGQLLSALGDSVDPAASRAQLIAQMQRSALSMAADNAKAFAVAERIALSHCNAEQGIRGKNGRHLLVGLGDMAQWVRSRLLDASYFAYVVIWYKMPGRSDEKRFAKHDEKLGTGLRQLLPDALLTAQVSLGLTDAGFCEIDEPSPRAAAELLAKAIVAERARPYPLSDRQLTWVVAMLAKRRPDLARPIIDDVHAHWSLVDGAPTRTGLQEYLRASWRAGVNVEQTPIARAATRWNADQMLHDYVELFDPNTRLFTWEGLTPTTTWTELTIDYPKNGFSRFSAGRDYAVSWDGWLKIETPGRYEFQVHHQGRFKAAIADLTLTNDELRSIIPTTVARSRTWASGWVPLRIDYEHRDFDAAECRLQWKPPGAAAFTAIPAAFFAHGTDRAPGLSARAIEAHRNRTAFEWLSGVTPATFTWATTIPWHFGVQSNLGATAIGHRQFRQALPLLRAVAATDPARGNDNLATCLLMQSGAELDEGLAILRAHHFTRGYATGQRLLISHLRDERRVGEFSAIMQTKKDPSNQSDRYLWSLIAVTTGNFTAVSKDINSSINSYYSLDYSELYTLCLLDLAVSHMFTQPTPGYEGLIQAGITFDSPGYLTAVSCLNGKTDPQVIATLSMKDQDLVRWAAALLELSEGNHAQAEVLFAALATNKDTDPAIAEMCRDLLAWYATQAPKTLSAVPKAAPVKRQIRIDANAEFNDF